MIDTQYLAGKVEIIRGLGGVTFKRMFLANIHESHIIELRQDPLVKSWSVIINYDDKCRELEFQKTAICRDIVNLLIKITKKCPPRTTIINLNKRANEVSIASYFISGTPFGYFKVIHDWSWLYYIKYGSNYWKDLISSELKLNERLIINEEDITWITSFAPFGNCEIMGISKGAYSLNEKKLCNWIVRIVEQMANIMNYNRLRIEYIASTGQEPYLCDIIRIYNDEHAIYTSMWRPEDLALMLRRRI